MPAFLNLAPKMKPMVALGAPRSGQNWPFSASFGPSWCLQTEPLVFHNQWDINGIQMSHC